MTDLHLPPIDQLGRTNLDTEFWPLHDLDGEHRFVLVTDLTETHRRNLLAYLRRHAVAFWSHHQHLLRSMWQQQLIDDATFGRRLTLLHRTPAPVWIEDTALVRRLVALTPAESRPPRRRRLLPARLLAGGRR